MKNESPSTFFLALLPLQNYALPLMLGITLFCAPIPTFAKEKPVPSGEAAESSSEETKPASAKPKAAKEKPSSDKAKPKGDEKAKVDGDTSKPEQLGSYGDWVAYVAKAGREKTCYALGQPKERQPKGKLKDTPGYIFISSRPSEGIRNEIAINLGYATKDNSIGTADIDGESYDLVTKGTNAWIKDQSREKEIVGALRGGAKLTIKASSLKGTATSDLYSLKGLADALARVAQECK